MREVAQEHQDMLPKLKDWVEDAYKNQKENNDRYHEFIRFVFASALTAQELQTLVTLKKPNLEFGMLESFISRLCGEFADQEPNLQVRAADGIHVPQLNEQLTQTMQVVEDHLREIISNNTNDSFEYNVYTDLLAGGFSVAKVFTDYINEMSFEQTIQIERAFDPTLCGFDPLARKSHKGDGLYCFEIFPKTKEEYEEEYGKDSTIGMAFARDVEGFNWSYENYNIKTLLIVDFYLKKRRKEQIVKLSNGHIILKKHYEQLQQLWTEKGFIEQCPIIIQKRSTQLETICRYRFCENTVLEYVETDFKYLPLVFFEGNAKHVRKSTESPSQLMTRPYVYQAKGIQKLMNFCGQTIAGEIETMVQHKFKVAVESVPEDYKSAYQNVQMADVLMYNAFYKGNTDVPLPAPMEIQRTPTPPIVESTFLSAPKTMQAVLGSYDAQMGIMDGRTSGKAITQGAKQSNAAAIPFTVGYIKGLNRVGQILLDLIPKYYVTPRSLPTRKANGIRGYQIINDPQHPESINLQYDPNSLQIKIEVGVNSSLQKEQALEAITKLAEVNEMFAKFLADEGLETLLENIDIKGIDQLKLKALTWAKKYKEAEAQKAQEPNEIQLITQTEKEIEFAKVQQRQMQSEAELAIKTSEVAIKQQEADTDFIKLMATIEQGDLKALAESEKADAENAREAVQLAIEMSKHNHEKQMAEKEASEKPAEVPKRPKGV